MSVAPAEVQSPETGAETERDLPWVTIVWNDPVNLMSYVTYVFQKVFGYAKPKAEKLMLDVHHKGRAVVSSGAREAMERDAETAARLRPVGHGEPRQVSSGRRRGQAIRGGGQPATASARSAGAGQRDSRLVRPGRRAGRPARSRRHRPRPGGQVAELAPDRRPAARTRRPTTWPACSG